MDKEKKLAYNNGTLEEKTFPLEIKKQEEKSFPLEIKTLTDEGTFEGYAAIFNKPDDVNEIIESGAFTRSIKAQKQFTMLWYHTLQNPIGVIDVEEDEKGLKVKGTLNLEVQSAKEKYALMKQKAIRGLSIGFRTIKDAWENNIRHLKEIKLYEVSLCTFPAHPQAVVTAIKAHQAKTAVKSFTGMLEFLNEFKSGKVISAANLKLLNNAVEALGAILKKLDPSDDTQDDKKSIYSSVIKELETEDNPQEHLFGSTIKTLEKSNGG